MHLRVALVSSALALAGCASSSAKQAPGTSEHGHGHEHAQEHAHEPGHESAATGARIGVPESIRKEHEAIHAELVNATKAPDPVGQAARDLAHVLHPHFVREEEIALPPLGLLRPLVQGEFDSAMKDVLPMTDALRKELPQMLREHGEIAAAAQRLEEVARQAGNVEVERLARALQAHAKAEEEVFYPAAVLVGEVVRARSEQHGK